MKTHSKVLTLASIIVLASCVPQPPPTPDQTASLKISFVEGAYTQVPSATLSLSWSSISATEMKISEDATCSSGTWEPAQATKVLTLSVTEGKKTYSAQVRDSAAKTTTCVSSFITFDQTAPTGSVSMTSTQPLPSSKVDLILAASDSNEVKEMSVKESTDCLAPVWEAFATKKTLTASGGDGTKNISAIFKDSAGNISSCYTTSVVVTIDPTLVIEEGRLNTDGKSLKDENGNVVILRGVNIADPEVLDNKPWERPGVTAMSVVKNAITNYNVNVIRIPILPGSGSGSSEGWFSKANGQKKYFDNHVKALVKYITDQKIYAIIDLHYISDYSSLKDNVLSFWTFMAPQFADNPYVIYEIFNEPINPDSWATWKSTIAQPAVNKIREFAPKNLIIVGGPGWSSHMADAATSPVTGTNIVYTAHIYSNQGPDKWESRFGNLTKKYPVFVTEWGFEESGTEGGTASGYGTPFLAWIEQRNLSWTAWCFDVVWGPRMFDENWNLLQGNGGMGVFVQQALEKNP